MGRGDIRRIMGTILLSHGSSYATIQKALDTPGATIIFSDGIYNVTKTLYHNSWQHIILRDNAVLRNAGPINHILMSRTYKNTTKHNGAHDTIIEGGTIEGMGKYGNKFNLLTLWHAKNISVRGTRLLDAQGFHSLEANACQNVVLDNIKFHGYNSDKGNDFREMLQIDFASEGQIFVFESGSKCYDGTCCQDITIRNCDFGPSEDRFGPSYAIGNHAQSAGGRKHRRITIEDCRLSGRGTNANGSAFQLIGMEDVTIRNTNADGFGRFGIVYAKDYSYDKGLKKVDRDDDDGVCRNIIVENCKSTNPTGSILAHGLYVNRKYPHSNIRSTKCSYAR